MKKNVCLMTISCSYFLLKTIMCSAMGGQIGVESPNPFLDILANTRTFVEFCDKVKPLANRCGICGDEKFLGQQYWPHPFGGMVHDECYRMISGVENATINQYRLKPELIINGDDVHKILVWTVMKLCLPHTLKQYVSAEGADVLSLYYRNAASLAVLSYQSFLDRLEYCKQQNKHELIDKISSNVNFFAGAIFHDSLEFNDINMTDMFGNTLLMQAAKMNDVNRIELLLKEGAKTDLVNKKGENALLVALKHKALGAARIIVDSSSADELNMKKSQYSRTALMRVARLCDDDQLVEAMIKKGAHVNAVSKRGDKSKTAFSIAYSRGNIKVAEILKKMGTIEKSEENRSDEVREQ